uniref:Uncharacterized protein n=1 Tax=Candidatus Kentrum sp. LPFa TaxID=2126335 RepID=A0A450X3J9_9GAMM|nr:MAG: hypothetical protein BECKLPF1236B_GA0070989_13844 [Candidatus Kentron sp. LPFa]
MKDEHTGNTSEHNTGTDWEKLRGMSDADIRAAIALDADAIPTDEAFWESAKVVLPHPNPAKPEPKIFVHYSPVIPLISGNPVTNIS